MNFALLLLCLNAAAIGLLHTIVGPDHYVPFVALAGARNWTMTRTLLITAACALAHLVSSAGLALLGVALGLHVEDMTGIDSVRSAIATWGLIAFGAIYALWGLHRARQECRAHVHLHAHHAGGRDAITPWVLFTIFGFGPCEPLIPLMLIPAAGHNWSGVVLTAVSFGFATLATMIALVALGRLGVQRLPLDRLERYRHALAGATIFATGGAIRVLGL